MFLGPAAVGKTSLRHGLMNQPLPDKPDSTILAQTRPVKYSWVKIAGTDSDYQCMAEVTEEDELDEEAQLVHVVSAEENSDMSHNRIDGPHHSLEAQSHEEVEKHTQQVLAKVTQMQSQHTKQQEMWLHLWDCGGQPVFLDVLPAFLSSRTVFLLMFDAAKGLHSPLRVSAFNKGERKDGVVLEITTLSLLQKWIASIHARFGDTEQQGLVPRIILVGTHGDQLAPGRSVQEKKRLAAEILQQLNMSFEGKGYADMVLGTGLVVDNTTAGKGALADSGFRDLHSAIFTFVQEKLSTKTPVSWVHFRKVLQLHTKKKKPVIKLEEVYSIAAECHVPEDEVHSALLFYHELGVFLFYPNIEGLKSVVILEPQRLVDWFGELFASWKGKAEYRDMWNTLTRYGVLVEPLFEAVLNNVREHNLTPGDLVRMLEHFLLAAPIVTTWLHAKSGKVKEYFVPHMLQHHLSQQYAAPPLTTSLDGISFMHHSILARSASPASQNSVVKEAAPIHITFLSGYVPPGYYVRLVTSLASIEGVMVLFHTGIYRDQISMDIGVDRLTITEHNETIELQFSRQEYVEEPFQKSCRRLLLLLKECISKVHRWLPGANTQLAFSCSSCPQHGVPSRAKFCPFTFEQYTNQHLRCHIGHKSMPSPCHKYWLQYKMNTNQQEQVLFEEKIHLSKPVHPGAVLNLAKQLGVDPLSAVIHQYRQYGGDDDELVRVLSDMKLTTFSRPDVLVSQSISDASQLSTAALAPPTASRTSLQDSARIDCYSFSGNEAGRSSRQRGTCVVQPAALTLQPPTSSGSQAHGNKPTILKLKTMKGLDGNPLNIFKRIAGGGDYMLFGALLLKDEEQVDVKVIKMKHKNDSPEIVVGEFAQKWLEKGGPTCTYQHFIDCVREYELNDLADLIHDAIHREASNMPKLISTTDISCSGQDTSTNVGTTGVASSTTSGKSSLRGAVQPAALTLPPPTSAGSQAHGKPLTSSSAYRAVLHCSNWHQLGILLNVDRKTLEEISSSKREGPSACKAAMLDAWLKGNANASWRQLADALKDMGDLNSSKAVEKYC